MQNNIRKQIELVQPSVVPWCCYVEVFCVATREVMSNRDKLTLISLPCPRCEHENAFEVSEVVGPLGIFCVKCGSAFERTMLARIRQTLRHRPAHASAPYSLQGKFVDNVHAPSSNAGLVSSSGWDLR